jgi:hypothetical protein
MRPETLEKVLEKLATTDKATIVVEKAPEGKIRVTSGSWDGEKVILKGQVLEVHDRCIGVLRGQDTERGQALRLANRVSDQH